MFIWILIKTQARQLLPYKTPFFIRQHRYQHKLFTTNKSPISLWETGL